MKMDFLKWTAAAALALGGASAMAADPVERTGDKIERAAEKTGDKIENAADRTKDAAKNAGDTWSRGRIHTMLSQVTEASLTKGGLDDVVERFVDADRNRMGAFFKDGANKAKLDVLDGRIAQFQKDWKAKYGHDFDIKQDDVVFGAGNFASVVQGEIGKDAQLAGQKLPPAQDVKTDNLGKPVDNAGNTTADKNLDKGRNVGYVLINKGHDLPELKVPVIHELPDAWKIDVPDNIDGQKLYDNMLKHLTMANEMKDKWPADENEAYRAVAHHVLMAILGVDDKADAGAAKLGGDAPERK